MKVYTSLTSMRAVITKLKQSGKRIGFVPTMGALHEGHACLLRRARRDNDVVVLSIFVNPLQFGPHEDYARYPRVHKQDEAVAQRQHVDIVFYPSAAAMYPKAFLTQVHVEKLSNVLCGASRPGHFRGVTTVVAKLFNIVQPDNAYFGQKDYQQLLIIKRMVADLALPVRIVRCPIVRERDGLAMSSRNVYLSPEERLRARILYRALRTARTLVAQGERDARRVVRVMRTMVRTVVTRIDYIAVRDAVTFEVVTTLTKPAYIGIACYVGTTRLIDNVIVQP